MKYLTILSWLFIFPSVLIAQNADERPNTLVQSSAENMMTFSKLKYSAFSFFVKDLKTGEVLADYNKNMSLPSASTMKLVTTASAFQLLGSGYRFETKIMYSGEIDSTGTLNGDLYIIGGGDPTLGSKYFTKYGEERDFLYEWADSVKAKGIKKINGHVIADGSLYKYQGMPSGWVWGDMGNYYGAGPAGLTIFDNMCIYHFKTGASEGDSTELTCITPHIPGIQVVNNVTSANSSKDNAYVYGAPWSYEWFVEGSIPKQKDDFEVKASIPDPELVMGLEFDYALEQSGIDVAYKVFTMRELNKHIPFEKPELKEIHVHKSPYLSTIINVTNQQSINLFAEHILCQISVERSGYGSTYNGALICMNYWSNKIGAADLNMTDGSGLSRSNSVSARFLVEMLGYMYKSGNGDRLETSMALAGKRGTMASMCKGTVASGRVYGKSGTMTRVKSYAGYVHTKSGRRLGYAMIMNNYTCSNYQMRNYFEGLMKNMANY
ncbi:D-alanyl-D-alanine carboxypeptidase/D-alanyl-D-alanine-endopeptidase [Paracrocinitomix mangrovi]|uniref:D-alanyl-D-alanine carboxypeptidase/D-alanyl-D-alanine endopeptidase n=1 Tax=Paracrocinitomix mangrovi TaxID=2862509 RepID=UPI001C8D70AF|nr:D-alanyl-D-alanine carboxypeptidase/D-alanyl-D-alanine-endopeptidase [Paracrocinitomix mangrovi]UKN02216.1 D-alanyl-D-alanine carboxypeptidase/D-alanyl-D-alanine-endopeptidase [Paracrocinitomix mangrovi]